MSGEVELAIKVGVLTISDRSSRGEREDLSGQVIKDIVSQLNGEVVSYDIVPDDKDAIVNWLTKGADELGLELILTTGGTGLTPRDVTPEATLEVVEKVVPGLAEVMRSTSLQKTPFAMLSRAVAGVRGQCLIVNLPGSPKAVRECLEAVAPALPHAVELMKGDAPDSSHTPRQP